MSTVSDPTYFNKSAYVALSCLIAFVVVITICVVKQFIWDPLLSKPFEEIRPVLSESVRKLSPSFYRLQSSRTSTISIHKSLSDVCVNINEPSLLSSKNFITVTQSLPTNDNQYNPINRKLPPRSYGSASFNSSGYINHGSDVLNDEEINSPTLHFSCEYNPTTYSINLNVQDLCHMHIFKSAIKENTSIFIRFLLSKATTNETSAKPYEDFIHFGEIFTILSNIHPGDTLNYEIKFSLILIIDENTYEIAEAIYSMKNDCLTYVLFVERALSMNLKLIESKTK